MRVIGLTGSIASGKSVVAKTLKELGARVIDADVIAREVVRPGTAGWLQIREVFGEGVINPDLTINRRALGSRVFGDPVQMRKLNAITHPIIIEKINRKINRFRRRPGRYSVLVIDASLLIETGMHRFMDEVWVVDVPEETQVRRLMERDGLTGGQALKRIRSQLPAAEKKKYADIIIDNSGDAASTQKTVRDIWMRRFSESGVQIIEN